MKKKRLRLEDLKIKSFIVNNDKTLLTIRGGNTALTCLECESGDCSGDGCDQSDDCTSGGMGSEPPKVCT
ncbi:MAG: hypothetical protein WBA74_20695 [Cyclobacteriaceae bacterium]